MRNSHRHGGDPRQRPPIAHLLRNREDGHLVVRDGDDPHHGPIATRHRQGSVPFGGDRNALVDGDAVADGPAGDAVAQLPADGSAMRVGPGLLVSSSSSSNDGNNFLVTARPGVLRQTKGGKLWVEARSRR